MGIDIITSIHPKCPHCQVYHKHLVPADDRSSEALKQYKLYQPLRARITAIKGSETFRSIKQLNLYWAAADFTADNADTSIPELKYWNTKDNVDHQLRVALHFVDNRYIAVHPMHGVVFRYKSIALKNLKHIAACNYFNEAFKLMAAALNMDDDEFIAAVKSKMIGGHY